MSRPVVRFTPSRRYLAMALFALGGTVLSVWIALRWGPAWLMGTPAEWNESWWTPAVRSPAWIAAIFFALSAAVLLAMAFRPAIEIFEKYLRIGSLEIPWNQLRRLDQTGWNVPLALYLTYVSSTTKEENRLLVLYPGDFDSCATLLRYLRRYAREALIDGIPYRQFWGEPPSNDRKQLAPPRYYPVLRPEDEAEVEKMFQRLKTKGHLEHEQLEHGDPDKK